MSLHVYTFSIIEYISYPKILIYYSYQNQIQIDEFKNVFTNFNFNMSPGTLFSFEFNNYKYNLFANENKIIFCVITNLNYPTRLICECTKELEIQFVAKYNLVKNYKELQFNSDFTNICKKLYDKYNNPESIDNLMKVNNKINQIKDIMHENISQSLENIVKMETIELKTEELIQSAGIFENSAKQLKNKMWWKNLKIKLIIFSIIAIILTIIISVSVVSLKQK